MDTKKIDPIFVGDLYLNEAPPKASKELDTSGCIDVTDNATMSSAPSDYDYTKPVYIRGGFLRPV